MIALLASRFGDLDLADESVQDSLLQAVETWSAQGVPENPPAWLYTVARNRAVDRLRRAAAESRRRDAAGHELTRVPEADASWPGHEPEEPDIVEEAEVGDEQLRLLLLCCHPALDRDAQVALTLRLVGGLTTAEIAAAFLLDEKTLAQRIVRAKRKIRAAGIPLTIPARLEERVDALGTVLGLIFNEGYLARTDAAGGLTRAELADQAIRVTEAAVRELPEHPELAGLLALERYARAREATRTDAAGELVLLEQQDRSRWDGDLIAAANRGLRAALAHGRVGAWQVQALIASLHANSPTAAETDWAQIADLYATLQRIQPTPVVALNRAVAVAMADGPPAGLAQLACIDGLEKYHLFHATRAELLARTGETAEARAAFDRALELVANPAERRHLERRRAAVGAG